MKLFRFEYDEIVKHIVDIEADDLMEAEAKLNACRSKTSDYRNMEYLNKCPKKYKRERFGVRGIYYKGYFIEYELLKTFTSEELAKFYPEETPEKKEAL